MAEVAGQTVVDGRYKITGRIGSGGMADVYCADDTHLGREVALKILHRRFSQDEEFVERFRREASAAAGLQHPNVVGVFDRGSHDDTWYIAMERLKGRTLKQVVHDDAPLDQQPRDRPDDPDPARPPASRTSAASCTATSSRTTSSSPATTRSRSRTSASPARARRR